MTAQPEERRVDNPESHAHKQKREPKKKKVHPLLERHPVLGRVGVGLATAAAALGLACTPAARAQTSTTPRTPATSVQSPDVRVAPATVPGPATSSGRPPRPELVAQTSTGTVGYDQTSTGTAGPNPTDRVLEIPTTEQPVVVTGEEARQDFGYMFENRNATVKDLPAGGKITMGDWEVEVTPSRIDLLTITIRNASLGYEYESGAMRNSKLVLLPFPETEYAKGPLFAIVNSGHAEIYFYNKVSRCVTFHLFSYSDLMPPGHETPEVGTDVYNNEPYLVVVRAGSRTSDGDVLPGTSIFQYALVSHVLDGDSPGAGTSYFVRGND